MKKIGEGIDGTEVHYMTNEIHLQPITFKYKVYYKVGDSETYKPYIFIHATDSEMAKKLALECVVHYRYLEGLTITILEAVNLELYD